MLTMLRGWFQNELEAHAMALENEKKSEMIGVKVSATLKNAYVHIAEKEDRTLSYVVARAMEEYIELKQTNPLLKEENIRLKLDLGVAEKFFKEEIIRLESELTEAKMHAGGGRISSQGRGWG